MVKCLKIHKTDDSAAKQVYESIYEIDENLQHNIHIIKLYNFYKIGFYKEKLGRMDDWTDR